MTGIGAAFQHIVRHPAALAALLMLGAAITVLAAAASFIWWPARIEGEASEAAFEKAAAEVRELRYRIRLAEEYATRRGQVEALEAKLRQVKSEPEFVRDIEALVARSGATVTQFSLHAAEPNAGVSATYFEFFLNGTYASLRSFIAGLPDLNEFVAIERVSLEQNGPAVRAFLVLRRRHKAG
jgi:Tfp pilus assembly protein PilO